MHRCLFMKQTKWLSCVFFSVRFWALQTFLCDNNLEDFRSNEIMQRNLFGSTFALIDRYLNSAFNWGSWSHISPKQDPLCCPNLDFLSQTLHSCFLQFMIRAHLLAGIRTDSSLLLSRNMLPPITIGKNWQLKAGIIQHILTVYNLVNGPCWLTH